MFYSSSDVEESALSPTRKNIDVTIGLRFFPIDGSEKSAVMTISDPQKF